MKKSERKMWLNYLKNIRLNYLKNILKRKVFKRSVMVKIIDVSIFQYVYMNLTIQFSKLILNKSQLYTIYNLF